MANERIDALNEAEVRQAAEAFVQALENLDIKGVMAPMAPSTILFFPPEFEKTIPSGLTEIEAAWGRVFDRIRTLSPRTSAPYIRIAPQDLRITLSGDVALVTFTFAAPDGSNGRRTLVFQKTNGRLWMMHLHGSSDR